MTVATRIDDLVAQLTLDEKVLLLEGRDSWFTNGIERLGIPSICLTDGPHGVRKVRADSGAFGVGDNEPATAFPPAGTVAHTWDPEAARAMGVAIAREAAVLGVDVVLAPGVNLKRNPLGGRNFEYYSEDPLLSGVLGTAFVAGVEGEGIASSVKHFAANSNEDFRFVGDSLVDERALRELYLRQFERIVRGANPSTVMCAYNAVNGIHCSDHRGLLTDILRDEWGFDGVVMTDWGATHDRVAAVAAGCELDMPGSNPFNRGQLIVAVQEGRLPVPVLDEAVRRMLALIAKATDRPTVAAADPVAHADLARRIATEGAVLLANDGTLPLTSGSENLLVVGELFERMRFQGAGSSLVTPSRPVTPRAAFDARDIAYRYARGYRTSDPGGDPDLVADAVAAARDADTVLFFGGLTDFEESEGFDRATMALGADQVDLLEQLLDAGARVVLVLFAGAPVELPFADRLAAVLDMCLPGMRGGDAVADLLFGVATPSGKLAETWPVTAADASSAADFDAGPTALYAESIYLGYRASGESGESGARVRFPFGFGLSYTTFSYRDVRMTVSEGHVRVDLDVANTGARDGVEIVQLYVRNNRGAVFKADRELRAFGRVTVPAGAVRAVHLEFDLDDLAYWDVRDGDWRLENGDYDVLVAASSVDVRATLPLRITTGSTSRSPYPAVVDSAYATAPQGIPSAFAELLGRPVSTSRPAGRLGMETRLADAQRSLLGRILLRAILGRVGRDYREALALPDGVERDARVKNGYFLVRMMPTQSLRSLTMSSSGAMPYPVAAGLADLAAGRPLRGLRRILTGRL